MPLWCMVLTIIRHKECRINKCGSGWIVIVILVLWIDIYEKKIKK